MSCLPRVTVLCTVQGSTTTSMLRAAGCCDHPQQELSGPSLSCGSCPPHVSRFLCPCLPGAVLLVSQFIQSLSRHVRSSVRRACAEHQQNTK
jgi:hypothetical protein